jgi:tRNA pseudouridine55 synthase
MGIVLSEPGIQRPTGREGDFDLSGGKDHESYAKSSGSFRQAPIWGSQPMAVEPERELQAGRKRPKAAGIIILDKPKGPTSREVVNLVGDLLPRAKVGHAGTLDPLASGILIVCVGVATRLIEIIQDLDKSYRSVIRLGARSDTHDALGSIVLEESPRAPTLAEVREALAKLVGRIVQTPPDYSAVKIKGRRAYDLARAGQTVDIAPRLVQIDRIEAIGYSWPHLELEIDCAKGTYIRSIARDLGEALGCGGMVETLDRTRIGQFTKEQATDPRELSRENIAAVIRPPLEAAAHLRRLLVDEDKIEAIRHGQTIAMPDHIGPADEGEILLALVDGNSRLVALAEPDFEQKRLQPRKVLIS